MPCTKAKANEKCFRQMFLSLSSLYNYYTIENNMLFTSILCLVFSRLLFYLSSKHLYLHEVMLKLTSNDKEKQTTIEKLAKYKKVIQQTTNV